MQGNVNSNIQKNTMQINVKTAYVRLRLCVTCSLGRWRHCRITAALNICSVTYGEYNKCWLYKFKSLSCRSHKFCEQHMSNPVCELAQAAALCQHQLCQKQVAHLSHLKMGNWNTEQTVSNVVWNSEQKWYVHCSLKGMAQNLLRNKVFLSGLNGSENVEDTERNASLKCRDLMKM